MDESHSWTSEDYQSLPEGSQTNPKIASANCFMKCKLDFMVMTNI